jgi:hypothetical protein
LENCRPADDENQNDPFRIFGLSLGVRVRVFVLIIGGF